METYSAFSKGGNVAEKSSAKRIAYWSSRSFTRVNSFDLTINPAVPETVGVMVVERNEIDFNAGSATVHEEHARQLDRFVVILNAFPRATVAITAHADQRNDIEQNQAISDERAQAVADYFVSRGIDPGRISAVGAGESQPLILAESDEAYAVNRRVDFLFNGLLSG